MQLTQKQINMFISYICIDDIIAYIEKHQKEYEDFAKMMEERNETKS